MATVQVAKNIDVKQVLKRSDVTPTQLNMILALLANQGSMPILDLITCVRKANSGYRFVDDKAFHNAVLNMHKKKLVVYG